MNKSPGNIKYALIIPAYNPDSRFLSFVRQLREGGETVIVIDDGSAAESQQYFTQAENAGCTVLRHDVNAGKGKALRTGFEELTRLNGNGAGFDYAVTADCDGQHSYDAIKSVVRAAAESLSDDPDKPSIIIGGRFRDRDDIPLKSKIGNNVTRWIFKAATGMSVHDTQTGLRAVPAWLFENMLSVKGNRYEYEMNMLLSVKGWDAGYLEIPIETIYYDNNSGSHFHPFRDSLLILSQIIKFACSSIISFCLDYILFLILSRNMRFEYAYAISRCTSGVFNYFLNAKVVFGRMNARTFVKYIILWAAILAAGSLGGRLIEDALEAGKLLSKIFVDLPLFAASYFGQKYFVFRSAKKRREVAP